MEYHAPPFGGNDRRLKVIPQQEGGRQGGLVRVGPGELLPPGLGPVGGQLHPGGLAVGKEEQHMSHVVPGDAGPNGPLLRVHPQLGGQKVPQDAGLGVVEVGKPGLVALLLVGEHQQLIPVIGLPLEIGAVPLLVLLVAGHPQGLGGDFFQIALLGEEQADRVVGDLLLRRHHRLIHVVVDNLGPPGDGVLLLDLVQLIHNDFPDALGGVDHVLQVGDLVGERVHLLGALEDIFLVDVPQPDIRHILRLNLVDAEADHQVGDNLGVLLGVPDNLDGPVDIQQNAPQAP